MKQYLNSSMHDFCVLLSRRCFFFFSVSTAENGADTEKIVEIQKKWQKTGTDKIFQENHWKTPGKDAIVNQL